MRRSMILAAMMLIWAVAAAPVHAADFGLNEFSVTYTGSNGEPTTRAGAHPFAMTTRFHLDTESGPIKVGCEPADPAVTVCEYPVGAIKNFAAAQITGLAGDQTAVPTCSALEFLTKITPRIPTCPNSTVVGIAAVAVNYNHSPTEPTKTPIYFLEPAPGAVAKLGFWAEGVPVAVDVKVSEQSPYRLVASTTNTSQVLEIYSVAITLWGIPADPVHDTERGACYAGEASCPAEAAEAPFLTMPRACEGPLTSDYTVNSWQQPGQILAGSSAPFEISGCPGLGFDATVSARPTTTAASNATGLDFSLTVHDPGITDPQGIANSDLHKAVISLPEGMTANPSVANGLDACTEVQLATETAESGPGSGCPEASKLGTVEVDTPLLGEALSGNLYLAKPFDNPTHSLIALYMVIRSTKLGILFKIPLRVEPDARTGRLVTVAEDLPPYPFEDFRLHFREGPRAPLVTPPTCGTFGTVARLYPSAAPDAPSDANSNFTVSSSAGGGACADTEAALPNEPGFEAGTTSPLGGSYSPFVLKLTREEGSQHFGALNVTLPPGLTGKLAATTECSDAEIAQAEGRKNAREGITERQNPSCPASSELGVVNVGAGAGTPLYVQGHAYLAGPYKGAPLSMVIITPAVAGPFDLGAVVVRSALYVDESTAQITVKSDPIPTILQGVPLDVRSIAVQIDRNEFTLNPTNCEAMALGAEEISTTGAIAHLDNGFQAGGCRTLGFAPKLRVRLNGATRRTGHPALKAVVTMPAGGAGIARAQVGLPHALFLDQGNLNKTCTRPVVVAGGCPATTVYGHAKAWTPLLAKPLEGNVYLVGGYGYKLPALVAELNGQIRILLKGRIDTTKQKGIRNTFEVVPDAPVSRFVLQMKGGKKYGLLENSEELCAKTRRANARFIAQNGKVSQQRPTIAVQCKKKNPKESRGKRKHHRAATG